MNGLYYIGLDVHKKHVSYVIKTAAGERVGAARRRRRPMRQMDVWSP